MTEMTVKTRQSIEKRIVRQFVKDAILAGYKIAIDNGGDEFEAPPSAEIKELNKLMFATDEEHLFVFQDDKQIGWVQMVYGNSGYDVITDYTTNLEKLLTNANALASRLEEKHS